MDKYRIYIDESGTHDYSKSDGIKERYLCLCGIILNCKVTEKDFNPCFYKLKRKYANDVDEELIFHREGIVNKKDCFAKLKNSLIQEEWDRDFLSLYKNIDFYICGIVLDKRSHLDKYKTLAKHPYHYCLDVLLERYVIFLSENTTTYNIAKGDVVAESRGKKEDFALKNEYKVFYEKGTKYIDYKRIQKHLSSKEIKIKPKGKGFWGLELADLLSLAVKLDVLYCYNVISGLDNNFTKVIIDTIQGKYRKDIKTGKIKGCGKKLIK
jgi:hypothetical protein